MAMTKSVQESLRRANVPYSVFQQPVAYTAQEEAAVTHVPGRDWAKTVVCIADGEPILAVLPADRIVNLEDLAALTGTHRLRLAREDELDWLFPDRERGGMPPFDPFSEQRVFADRSLAAEMHMVFNAGTHTDAGSGVPRHRGASRRGAFDGRFGVAHLVVGAEAVVRHR